MTKTANSKFRPHLKTALLAGVALVASGCAADWSGNGQAAYSWTQTPPIQADAQDPYALGKKQFADGLYGMALKSFRVALAKEPRSLDHLNAVAATYDKLGRFDLAERYYARALGVDPDSVQTLNNIGYSFLIQKDYVSARYYLEQAARIARAEDEHIDVVGANLVSLDMAEGGTTAFAALQRPLEAETMTISVDGKKAGAQGEVHTFATQQDVAKVTAAGTPGQAAGKNGAGTLRDETVLVPAALAVPEIKAAPVTKVSRVPLAARSQPAAKPTEPVKRPMASVAETLVEISNGSGRRHHAARTRQFLGDEGIAVGRLTNAEHFSFANSTIFYRAGYGDKAREIASLFPTPIELKAVKEQHAHIRVLLGADLLTFDGVRLAEFKGY